MNTRFLICLLATLSFTAFDCRADDPVPTSMIQLLANPEAFHGKLIRVSGYLHVKFEDSCLYLSKDDADHLNAKQGFWISYSEIIQLQPEQPIEKFDCKFVLIEGIFDKDENGHMGAAAGGIKKASRVMEKTRWYDGKKELTK